MKINVYKTQWPPDFKIHIDGRDVPMSDINPWPVIAPEQHQLLDIDKLVRSEYNPKHNLDMG